jgi:dihydroneopterin aldolase
MTFSSSNHERIFLRACRVMLSVGVHASEKNAPQPVVIDVDIRTALNQTFDDDNESSLARTVNYEPLYRYLTEDLPRHGHIHLLESVAEHITAFCFRDPRVLHVRICLEKPGIFPDTGGAGVEFTRRRPHG